MAFVHVYGDLYSLSGAGRVFHVNANEAVFLRRVLDNFLQFRPAEFLVHGEPETVQLDREAGVKTFLFEGVYDFFVLLELLGGVGLAVRALAEYIHRGDATIAVEILDNGYGVVQFVARDVAAGDLLHYRPGNDLDRTGYGFIYNTHVLCFTSAFMIGMDSSE